jgi:hypothetical protein
MSLNAYAVDSDELQLEPGKGLKEALLTDRLGLARTGLRQAVGGA